jgi:exonuclease III
MITVATWNMKQAVAPKKPLPELWSWIEDQIQPDVIVLTEARVPKEGLPAGWQAIWTPGGIGPRRTWGTIVAARNLEIREAKFPRNSGNNPKYVGPHPGSVHTVDVIIDKEVWATVVGAYGYMPESKNGWDALVGIANECIDIIDSGNDRVILAGDFNLWPQHIIPIIEDNLGLVDVMGRVDGLPELEGAVGGSRIWTHKNGNSPNAARQELDFIFVSDELYYEISAAGGGIDEFPDAWEMSDHAPVFIEFD